MKRYIFPILVTAFALLFLLSLVDHESTDKTSLEFTVERPYLAVMSNIATKNSLERIVEQEDGVVTGKEWNKFEVEVPQRLLRIREYGFHSEMKFIVKRSDYWTGFSSLPFVQDVKMNRESLLIDTSLSEDHKKLKKCTSKIEASPHLDSLTSTLIKVESEITLRCRLPFFLKSMMERRLKDYNEKRVNEMKEGIILIVHDQSPVITFKRGD